MKAKTVGLEAPLPRLFPYEHFRLKAVLLVKEHFVFNVV